jgi:hypothetical protein
VLDAGSKVGNILLRKLLHDSTVDNHHGSVSHVSLREVHEARIKKFHASRGTDVRVCSVGPLVVANYRFLCLFIVPLCGLKVPNDTIVLLEGVRNVWELPQKLIVVFLFLLVEGLAGEKDPLVAALRDPQKDVLICWLEVFNRLWHVLCNCSL